MHRAGQILPLVLLGILGAAILATAAAGQSSKPTYVICYRHDPPEKLTQHPRNCITDLSFSFGHSFSFSLFDFQGLSWRGWGYPRAEASGFSVNPETHQRKRVRFSVFRTEACEGQTFYTRLLIERPRRLIPKRRAGDLPFPSCGER